jgi:hypothetical protein
MTGGLRARRAAARTCAKKAANAVQPFGLIVDRLVPVAAKVVFAQCSPQPRRTAFSARTPLCPPRRFRQGRQLALHVHD